MRTPARKNLLSALRRGTNISGILVAIGAFLLIYFTFGMEQIGLFIAIIAGLLAGILIGYFTEYYTSDTYKPTQKLADTSETGSATLIIGGLGLGMKSTAIPVILVGIAVLVSYFICGGAANFNAGLYGVALSAVGMLSTLGITLATDAYGPVADNAGGIAEMAGPWRRGSQPHRRPGLPGQHHRCHRQRLCDRLRRADRSGSGCFLHRSGSPDCS